MTAALGEIERKIDVVAEDMTASFKQQATYQLQFEKQIEARFDTVDARLDTVDTRLEEIKNDMAAMENRMLDAFKQLLTTVESRLPARKER